MHLFCGSSLFPSKLYLIFWRRQKLWRAATCHGTPCFMREISSKGRHMACYGILLEHSYWQQPFLVFISK